MKLSGCDSLCFTWLYIVDLIPFTILKPEFWSTTHNFSLLVKNIALTSIFKNNKKKWTQKKTKPMKSFSKISFKMDSEAMNYGKFGKLNLWNEVNVEAGCPHWQHAQVRLCNHPKSRFPSGLLFSTFIESFKVWAFPLVIGKECSKDSANIT